MTRPRELLLVEDSPSDVALTRRALEENSAIRVHVCHDGVEAMAFLRRQDPFPQAPRPDLILLDLNLPRKDGREVLAEVKGDPGLRSIPVVVLTSSSADNDLHEAYSLHANAYVAKPPDFTRFREAIRAIESFWFGLAHLPPR